MFREVNSSFFDQSASHGVLKHKASYALFSKGGSIVECDDRDTSESFVLCTQEVPAFKTAGADVFTLSRQSTINVSTPGIKK